MFKSLKQLHWTIYTLAFASGVIWTGFAMLLPLLPAYTEQLQFNEFEIGLIVAAFFIGRVLFQFPLGILSDHYGRRLIMSASLLLFALTTAAYALTTDAALMVALRLMQGFASSGFAVGSTAYVNDRTPAGQRGLAAGVMSSAINAGIIAGPVIGGALSQAFTIQTPFWVGGLLGLISFCLSLAIPKMPGHKGALWPSIPNRKTIKQLLEPVLCRTTYSFSLINLLFLMGLLVFESAAPILTAEKLNWSANEIALAFAFGGSVAVITSPFWGHFSDQIGHLKILAAGVGLMALQGLIVFWHPGTIITIVAFALGGAGAPAYFNGFNAMIGDATDAGERGSVTGFVGSFGEWGSIIGSGVVMPLSWRFINVQAPMAIDFAILVLTFLLTISLKSLLKQQVGKARTANC